MGLIDKVNAVTEAKLGYPGSSSQILQHLTLEMQMMFRLARNFRFSV